MKRNRILLFVGGVVGIAVVTAAVVHIRHEMKKTEESIRQMVREAAVEAGREAGKEVRAGLIEGMDNVADRAEQMPAQIFQSATDELQRRVSGFADRVGVGNPLAGGVVEDVLEIVAGPSGSNDSDDAVAPFSLFEAVDEADDETPIETLEEGDVARDTTERLRETVSSVIQRVEDRGGELPRNMLENVLGDYADLPGLRSTSSDSPSRTATAMVPGDLDQIFQRYVPLGNNQTLGSSRPLETVDRILDDPGLNVTGLIDGILGHTSLSRDAED